MEFRIEFSIDNLSIENGYRIDYLVTQGNIKWIRGIEFDRNVNFTPECPPNFAINNKISFGLDFYILIRILPRTFNCANL
jgi:hypothetical protein